MHNISKLIRDNREEAYNIIKNCEGRVDFVEGIIKNESDYTKDNWDDTPSMYDIPWCTLSGDEGIIDAAVLAVKCHENMEKPNLEFLIYDNEVGKCIGWFDDACCCGNTANEVYEYIGGLFVTDMNGKIICEGDKVKWHDPENGNIIEYEVYNEPRPEMVKLWNKYGECEALPSECEVI